MITIAYLFLILPGYYTGPKLDIILFHIEDIDFSYGCIIFVVTSMEAGLQAAKFVTLTFMTQNNGVMGKNICHKASGYPLLCTNAALLLCVFHLKDNKTPPSTPISRAMTTAGRWKYITPTIIYKNLKTTVVLCGSNLRFEAKDVFAHSL